MNTYLDSFGNRWTTAQINRKSDQAAKELLEEQIQYIGYNVCTVCLRNDCFPIDVSHTISRKYAKENGCVEIIWSKKNMKIIGRRHHQQHDKLNLQWNTQ